MTRTLQPENRIGHYRIVGPLGAGGMGEVYLARDLTLERDVALKVLPPELVRSEDRLRRFMLEARSASSLNHPHIVTIYEIGQDAVRAEDGSERPEPGVVHYIAMELVSGRTLQDLIHREGADLPTLLTHLAQAAEGLAKAHAAGIVHRDLKPGNVMVSNDGYAKVLDFGLAKLTERGTPSGDMTSAPTEALGMTGAGVVLGTVGYMSPEQLANKSIDHRSDIFSFGCMLYEATTRHRAFVAETGIDTMHKILHAMPQAVDELNPTAPADLRRLIRRCLAKNPDQRLQSMKDLALELREIVEHFDELSASTSTGAVGLPASGPLGSGPHAAASPPVASRRSRASAIAIAAAVIVGVVGTGFGLWSIFGGARRAAPEPLTTTRMSSLFSDPALLTAALSGDGRYLAYVTGPEGHWSLSVRQVATGSVVQVLAPQAVPIRGISFSPDGNYLYYLGQDPETPMYSALFEVPSLGGAPRKRLFDVDCAVGFSPDGRRVAFVRGVPQENTSRLVLADLATGTESILASTKEPETISLVRPAWSPDGATIVVAAQSRERGFQARLLVYDATSGRMTPVPVGKTPFIDSFAWLADGRGLVATFSRAAANGGLFFVPYPSGPVRQITNDLADYRDLSVSSGGSAVAMLRASVDASMWSAPVDAAGEPRQLTSRSSDEGIGGLRAAEDGALFFAANHDQRRHLWTMAGDGSGRRQITSMPGFVNNAQLLPGGAGLVFTQFDPDGEGLVPHIFRVDLDGGNLRRLTDGTGETLELVAPDGKTGYYRSSESIYSLWRLPLDGGTPEKMLDGFRAGGTLSRDGRFLAHITWTEAGGRVRETWTIVPAAGGAPVATFDASGRETLNTADGSDVEWLPDGGGLSYVAAADGAHNLWIQPLSGRPPVQLTRFDAGRITGHEWSPDGARIAILRTMGTTRNLWTVRADGSRPVPMTDFRSGSVFEFEWARDGKSVFFTQGDERVEVVLIRDEVEPAS